MGTPVDTKGKQPLIEFRHPVGRYFIVFPDLRMELAMAPVKYEVAEYLAYHAWLGTPFHTRIPCYPRNTPYPRPNVSYPEERSLDIPFAYSWGEDQEVAIPQQKEEAVMATTVTVKARAWGAIVKITKKTEGEEGHNIETQEIDLGSNTTRDFTIGENERIEVEMGAAPPEGGQGDGEEPAPNPFDHDGDGKPGGSLPEAQRLKPTDADTDTD
jgi:hypothetical protein